LIFLQEEQVTPRILIVDDEENICFTLKRFLSAEGYSVDTSSDYESAVNMIRQEEYDLLFVDIVLRGMSGMDILEKIKEESPNCPVVMITGVPSVETAADAVRMGAFDYLPKPVRQDAIQRVAKAALRHRALVEKKEEYRQNLEAIFTSVKDAIITVDKELSVLAINSAATEICSFFRKDLIGRPLHAHTENCEGKCMEVLRETIRRKEPVEMNQVNCNCPHNPQRVATLRATPLLNRRGEFVGGVLVLKDETRLVDLERNLKERQKLHNIVGRSERIQEIYALIEDLADVRSTVLVTGESGTGKELVAEALHYVGPFSHKPLVKVNCAALSEHLLVSELFGHIKGAFTGAVRDKVGRFQRADGGTIFLDEIGEMTPRMQLHLLRVLQDMEFERVGDSKTIKVDVRVVAATNKNLPEAIAMGSFREDLYYRFKVVELNLPPLRQRKEDIPLLMDHFLGLFNKKFGKNISSVSDEVNVVFMRYDWPGNVRELQHALEHAAILCRGSMITMEHLPSELAVGSPAETMNGYEQVVLDALEKARWNKTRAALLLGISRQSLYRKLKAFNITDHQL
jgi:two-component system, NtrC family, response regulator HydG